MTDDTHEIPLHSVYRGVELWQQSEERLAGTRRQIDLVIGMNGPRALFNFAIDASNSPEARLLAKNKALATREERQRVLFDVDRLKACTIGIERHETRLGRLIGFATPWTTAVTPIADGLPRGTRRHERSRRID